ncbi:MAG: YjgN family protein [Alphaproteobacteria bacterium]|nr:YjgN family protein [Alphaproteobacteria bacterium]
MEQSVSESTPGSSVRHDFSYVGNGITYFGICIRTFLLAIITIGIYDAWGTVERRRYMFGNTIVAGHGFDYHASPKTILIGRLIVIGGFVALSILVQLFPPMSFIYLPLFVVGMPWVINRSMRFQLRNTSYRNVRFDFEGNYGRALLVFVGLPILIPITLGFAYPWVKRKMQEYLVNNAFYGTSKFSAHLPIGPLVKAYFVTLGLMVGALILLGILWMALGITDALQNLQGQSEEQILAIMLPLILFYILFILMSVVAFKLFAVVLRNTTVNAMNLQHGHRFSSTIPPAGYIWVILSRGFLATISAGLLIPWATVEIHRYKMRHMALLAAGSLDDFVSHHHAAGDATGAEVGALEGITDGVFNVGI